MTTAKKNARRESDEPQIGVASATPASGIVKPKASVPGSLIENARHITPETQRRDASATPAGVAVKSTGEMPGSSNNARHAVLETQSFGASAAPANADVQPTEQLPGSPNNARQTAVEAQPIGASAASPAKDELKPNPLVPDSPTKKGRQAHTETQIDCATSTPATAPLKPIVSLPGSPLSSTIEAIRAHHRERRFAMGIQQVLDRKLEAFIRINKTDWHVGDDETTRDKANKEVAAKIKAARKGEGDSSIIKTVALTDKAREPADKERDRHEKEMTALARQLPVASWVESVPGLGLLGLATIVAETGDLSNYPNVAKVWKRLGYAPYKGHAGSSWKRPSWHKGYAALTADEWIDNPFSGRRYSLMHVIAVWLLNKQWIGAAKTEDGVGKPKGLYGEIYARRRARTTIMHPDWSKKHSQMDGLRIMMKEVLKDLWLQWNAVERKSVDRQWEIENHVIGAITETPARDGLKPNRSVPGSPTRNGRQRCLEAQGINATETPAKVHVKPIKLLPGSPL